MWISYFRGRSVNCNRAWFIARGARVFLSSLRARLRAGCVITEHSNARPGWPLRCLICAQVCEFSFIKSSGSLFSFEDLVMSKVLFLRCIEERWKCRACWWRGAVCVVPGQAPCTCVTHLKGSRAWSTLFTSGMFFVVVTTIVTTLFVNIFSLRSLR